MNTDEKTLLVSAIEEGTVIDHITQGKALKIISLLNILKSDKQVTIGLNLFSQKMQRKDLIKIENRFLTEEEVQKIALFAPLATINIIRRFAIEKKMNAYLPLFAIGILVCPNRLCISRMDVLSHFTVEEHKSEISFHCKYCEKTFKREEIE